MMDIHNHIIYGIDDGAKDLDDSMAILRMAYRDGTRSIITTPHFHYNFVYENCVLENRFEEIKKVIEAEGLNLKFYLGHEAYLDGQLVESLKSGKCKTMADSRYVLVEVSERLPFNILRKMLFDLMLCDYKPIIAHCERLLLEKTDIEKMRELKKMDCYLQVSASAVLKPKKRWIRHWILKDIREGTISFVASDAHDTFKRPPLLQEAYRYIKRKTDSITADNVFELNAEKIITGEIII